MSSTHYTHLHPYVLHLLADALHEYEFERKEEEVQEEVCVEQQGCEPEGQQQVPLAHTPPVCVRRQAGSFCRLRVSLHLERLSLTDESVELLAAWYLVSGGVIVASHSASNLVYGGTPIFCGAEVMSFAFCLPGKKCKWQA